LSTWLPTAFESAVKTMIANGVSAVYNEATTLSIILAADCVKADPPACSFLFLTW
jgi:hypothetical protein